MKINTNLFDSQKKRTFSPKSFVNSTTNTYIYLMSKWQNSQKYSLQIAKIQLWQQEARKKWTLIKHVPRMNVKLRWELTAQSHTISVHIQSRNILLEFFPSRTRSTTNGFLFCLKSGPLKKFSFAKSTFPLTSGIHLLKRRRNYWWWLFESKKVHYFAQCAKK